MEEQKPNDIFEKGIKEESPDEDYFEDITPKLEQVIEPLTEFMSHQDLYLNNTQQIQMISNDESSCSSSQSFVENIKQEQNFTPFHFESINGLEIGDMKTEPIDDVDDDEMTKNSTVETVKKSHTMSSNSGQCKRRCSVCFELIERNCKLFKEVKLENDKLIIMIGCVLRGEYTIERAQSFIAGNNRLYICYAHFSEAFNAICNALHIEKPSDILTCSESLMNKLMSIVIALRPQLILSDFLNLIKNVFVRNENYIQMPVMDLILGKPASKDFNTIQIKSHTIGSNSSQRKRRCSVCSELIERNCKLFKEVKLENDKLIIMIGCVLRGEYTIERAQSFMPGSNRLYICYTHLSDAFNVICNALHIQDPNDIFTSSASLVDNLMFIVNNIRPQLSALHFHRTLKDFIVRNKDFIEMPVMQLKQGENAPKDLKKCKIEHLISMKHLIVACRYCRCSVCSQTEIRENMKEMLIENEKLIIMAGCILRGDSTFEEARSFIPSKKMHFICHVHFSDAIKEICNALHIQNPSDISWCSVDLMQKLMDTVNAICPQLSALDFQEILNQFVLKNKDFIQLTLLKEEMEEQPPINLNENKKEPEDFIENVKEEPFDDEYFEQIESKLEQFVDPCLPSTSSLSTQNIHFPQQSQNFGQNITEVQSFATELQRNWPPNQLEKECKQEADEFLEKVKEEPIDEEYFEGTVPKLEQFVDPCLPLNSTLPKARCAVCLQIQSPSKLKRLGRYDERLIIMLGRVLRREHTLLDAQLFLSKNRRKVYIFICHAHYPEIFNEIYKVLHINSCHEIETCSLDSIQILMPTVNSLISQGTPLQLRTLLSNVAVRYEQFLDTQLPVQQLPVQQLPVQQLPVQQLPVRLVVKKRKPKKTSVIARRQFPKNKTSRDIRQRHCSVCSLLSDDNSLKRVTVEDDKLLIMVGCILREEYTIERAQLFMSMRGLFSCRNHYRETLDEICKALNIQNHNRIYMSSSDLMENLMKIVNALRPSFTIRQFQMCFTSFVARNEHFEN